MSSDDPDLLEGTERCLVAEVPGAGHRWDQVHFNRPVVRQFFNLEPGENLSITLERISAEGKIISKKDRQLVYSDRNKNHKLEMDFGGKMDYPAPPHRPIVVVVEESYRKYRYRTLMPGDAGHEEMNTLLDAGPSVGRGVRRRTVTLDDVESYWQEAALRGAI